MDQVYKVLQVEDDLDVPKLMQQKLTLSGKSLEEKKDEEVEQADKVRKKYF